jgi:hypothetical protein
MKKPMSDGEKFALMVEIACEDFETLERLVRGELKLVSTASGQDDTTAPDWVREPKAKKTVVMSLAKSFLFHVARAKRITEDSPQFLRNHAKERRLFLKYLNSIGLTGVRNVNEHGFDAGTPDSSPSIHVHDDGNIALDETSLSMIGGKILMGPINLRDVYPKVKQMQQIAGFGHIKQLKEQGKL